LSLHLRTDDFGLLAIVIPLLLAVVWFCPNTQQLFGRYRPAIDAGRNQAARDFYWRPNWVWSAALSLVMVVSLLEIIASKGAIPFLYFRF
jgi:hypothetical protein